MIYYKNILQLVSLLTLSFQLFQRMLKLEIEIWKSNSRYKMRLKREQSRK